MRIEGAMLHDACGGTGFIEKDGKATACIECMGSGMIGREIELHGRITESEDGTGNSEYGRIAYYH